MEDEPDTPEVVDAEIVATKAEMAYQLLKESNSPSEVAEQLGYSSVKTMREAIKHKMDADATKLTSEERENILQMEMIGLRELRRAHYLAAMAGDIKSGEMLLHIHDRVMKAIGHDKLDTQTQQHAVLVIGGNEQSYVEKLKELSA